MGQASWRHAYRAKAEEEAPEAATASSSWLADRPSSELTAEVNPYLAPQTDTGPTLSSQRVSASKLDPELPSKGRSNGLVDTSTELSSQHSMPSFGYNVSHPIEIRYAYQSGACLQTA